MVQPRRAPCPPPPAAFSALELLLVVAILALLAAMFWRFETGSARQQKLKACQANLQRLYVALEIYAADHQRAFPNPAGATTAEAALAPLLPRYTVDGAAFVCPASGDAPPRSSEPLGAQRISFAYYAGTHQAAAAPLASDRQVNSAPKAPGQLVFAPDGRAPGNNHRAQGGNVLFAAGYVEHSPPVAARALVPAPGATLLNPTP